MAAKAILIGCATYRSKFLPDLDYAERDAHELWRRVVDPDAGGYAPHHVSLLTNPDYISTVTTLTQVFRSAEPTDSVLLYFAGHGLRDEAGNLFLAVSDTHPDASLQMTAISGRAIISPCRSQTICVILDCCFAGALRTRGPVNVVDAEQSARSLSGAAAVILAATQPSKHAHEVPEYGQGLFTKYLLRGIDGEADTDNNGVITPGDLFNYVSDHMGRDARYEQTPMLSCVFSDASFPLFTSAARTAKALKSMEDEVAALCEGKLHFEALAVIDRCTSIPASHRDQQRMLRTGVETGAHELLRKLEHEVLAARASRHISNETLIRVLTALRANERTVFVESPETAEAKLLRGCLTGKIQVEALEELWPRAEQVAMPATPILPPPAEPSEKPTDAEGTSSVNLEETQPPFLRDILLRPSLWLAAVALGLAFWIATGWLPSPDVPRLRIGMLVPENVNREKVRRFAELMSKQLVAQLGSQHNPEGKAFLNIRQAVDALKNKQVDIVGELSPYDIFEASAVGAQPFALCKHYGMATYDALIVVAANSQLLDTGEKGLRTEIKPKTWRRVLDALVAGTGQIAVTGKTSTSGYWFPRQEVLKYFERQHISLPFDDVTIPKLTWEEVKQAVVCGGQDIIAGALPAFRWTGQPIQCGDKRAELIPIYRDELPNGAFVAASHVASDQNLLEEIKIHWEKVIQSLPSGELEEYKVPEQWDFIDANHYASTMPMFRRPDPAEEVLNRRRKVAITAAAVILIACVGAYYWVAARARRV